MSASCKNSVFGFTVGFQWANQEKKLRMISHNNEQHHAIHTDAQSTLDVNEHIQHGGAMGEDLLGH
jgi:hypothetical protein